MSTRTRRRTHSKPRPATRRETSGTVYVVSIADIAKAYCSLLRKAGHDMSSIVNYGPRVAVKTLSRILGVPFETLLDIVIALDATDKGVRHEKSPLLAGTPMEHGVRLHRSIIEKSVSYTHLTLPTKA